jgi:hypothetical protein
MGLKGTDKEQLSRALAGVEMTEIAWPDGKPAELHATHEGDLVVGEKRLHCYQLSDGRRVVDADDVDRFFTEP